MEPRTEKERSVASAERGEERKESGIALEGFTNARVLRLFLLTFNLFCPTRQRS